MTNPYQSPSVETEHVPPARGRVWRAALNVVLLSVAFNAHVVVLNWPELTLLHHVAGVLLWLLVPFLAVYLLWRGKRTGRWILVGLFGLRAVGSLDSFRYCLPLIVYDPAILLCAPYRTTFLDILFYSTATTWLLFSPSIREGK